eukprot:m.24594 g.24594  ORF g.24594 m.24594 type:complete len:191 (-) comp6094_c0_seq1:1415-1987(-)
MAYRWFRGIGHLRAGGTALATVGETTSRTRCLTTNISQSHKIKYRGSEPYNELRTLSPAVAESVLSGTLEHRFLEAIHLYKYNKSYDEMFATMEAMCQEILHDKSTTMLTTSLEESILKSFLHHCANPRYGYINREISSTPTRTDVKQFMRRLQQFKKGKGLKGGGPTWWQLERDGRPQSLDQDRGVAAE